MYQWNGETVHPHTLTHHHTLTCSHILQYIAHANVLCFSLALLPPLHHCTLFHPLTTAHSSTPSPLHPIHPHCYTLTLLIPSHPHPCTPSQGPEHCNQCRNYYIEEILGAGSVSRVCVETCPQGTYLNTTSRQCIPCHEACQGMCAGPLPYVNRTFGCLECGRVELDREGRQVGLGEMILNTTLISRKSTVLDHSPILPLLSPLPSSSPPSSPPFLLSSILPCLPLILLFWHLCLQVTCLSSGCLPGMYSSTSTAAIGDLQSGSDVCIPCDPLCELCTGPGIQQGECILCRYATHLTDGCVRSCNATTGEEDYCSFTSLCSSFWRVIM